VRAMAPGDRVAGVGACGLVGDWWGMGSQPTGQQGVIARDEVRTLRCGQADVPADAVTAGHDRSRPVTIGHGLHLPQQRFELSGPPVLILLLQKGQLT